MSPTTCSKLMKVVAAAFGLYALLWSLAPFPSLNFPARLILDFSDWPVDRLTTPLDRNTMWLTAIASGLLAAISIILAFVVAPAIERGETNTIRTAILALIAWYVIDGIGSIGAGVTSNVFFNTIYLGLALAPLTLVKYPDEQKR